MKLFTTWCLLGITSALHTPFNAKFPVIETQQFNLSGETDFNLGVQLMHVGKPSDYNELQDEFRTSVNFKQWLKINVNAFDAIITSYILEWTWFEVQPVSAHFLVNQPEDIFDLFKSFTMEDVDPLFVLTYYLDALSLKLYTVKYPAFCAMDIAMMITDKTYIECGY